MKKITNQNDIPYSSHWVLLKFDTKNVHHEGDERSRTNPGHGYPAYTETFNMIDMFVYEDKQEWEAAIKKAFGDWAKDRSYGRPVAPPFAAYHVDKVAQIGVSVNIDITSDGVTVAK